MKILAGLSVVVAASRQEAEDRHAEMAGLMRPIVGKFFIGNDLEVDLSDLPLDESIPQELISNRPSSKKPISIRSSPRSVRTTRRCGSFT